MKFGLIRSRRDGRDYMLRAPSYSGGFISLRDRFPDEPYDQGDLGSCVANGVAAVADVARVASGLPPIAVQPSRLFIYYFGRVLGGYPVGQDTGLMIRDGLKALATYGVPSERTWPYIVSRFAKKPSAQAVIEGADDKALAYARVNISDVDAVIASGRPVAFGITCYESFDNGAVFVEPDRDREAVDGAHCMVLCSTGIDGGSIDGGIAGVTYRLVRNSWGTSWGDLGYAWLPDTMMQDVDAEDLWTVSTMGDPDVVKPSGDGVRVAVDAILADADVCDWVHGRRSGVAKRVASLVSAVLDARMAER